MEEKLGKKEDRTLCITMDPVYWKMLKILTLAVRTEQRKKKRRKPTMGKVTGAILAHFFLMHYEEILSHSVTAAHEEVLRQLRTVLHEGELEHLVENGTLQIPNSMGNS